MSEITSLDNFKKDKTFVSQSDIQCFVKGYRACNDESIKIDALLAMPFGRFCRFDKVVNQDKDSVECVVWKFFDTKTKDIRTACFDRETGEYICETF